LKLSAALPSTLRTDEARARQRIHIDPEPWEKDRRDVALPFLITVQQAVWESRVLRIQYAVQAGPQIDYLSARLYPYGLVAKAGEWYLVAVQDDRPRILRIDTIVAAEILEDHFQVPEGFHLEKIWAQWCQGVEDDLHAFVVTLRVHPDMVPYMTVLLGSGVGVRELESGQPDQRGWITYQVRFGSHEEARDKLLPFGGSVEVIDPLALRYSLKDYAEQILAVYSSQH
jgi:predicted DNA-binding transcriptional regulator YafY